MPSHAPFLPVGGGCFLNASIKCRILPDRSDWDSAASRDSSRSTPLHDSLLQRRVQEMICQSSLQPQLLSLRKMFDIWGEGDAGSSAEDLTVFDADRSFGLMSLKEVNLCFSKESGVCFKWGQDESLFIFCLSTVQKHFGHRKSWK